MQPSSPQVCWPTAASQDAATRAAQQRIDRKAYALLSLCWLALLLLIDPRAEVALNDDWAYSVPVQSLVETGRLQLTFWQSMPLLPQFAWGALFTAPFGFSFTALRLSTSVLGLLGVCVLYRLLRDRGATAPLSLVAALCLMTQPIYLALAHTFMSDVPFVTLLLASTLFYLRALDDTRWSTLVIATLLAVIATLIRQIGIVLPLGFALAWLSTGRARGAWARALVPLVVVIASLPISRAWIAAHGGLPALYDARDAGLKAALNDLAHAHLGVLRGPLERTLLASLHTGLALLPLSCLLLARAPRRQQATALVSGVVLAAGLLVVAFAFPSPVGGNILLALGVGPRNFATTWDVTSALPRQVLTLIGALGASALWVLLVARLAALVKRFRSNEAIGAGLLIVALCVVGWAPFSLAYGPHFDRYGLFLIPLLAVLLIEHTPLPSPSTARWTPAWLWLALVGIYSAAAVHDYISLNRAAWSLANAQQRKTPSQAVDAGFELNNYQAQHASLLKGEPRIDALVDRSQAPYAVDLVSPSGARVVARAPTHAWLPLAPQEVVLYARR